MKVKLIVDGGSMKPGPAIAQQLGPMGINLGKVIEDVNKATEGFRGIKVPVELDVDAKTKRYTIEVFSPPVAELLKKELGLETASGEAGKTRVGNIAFETVLKVAKTKLPSLPAKTLTAAITMVIGSCVSMGVLIDSKDPKIVNQEVEEGKYDKEIKEELTEPSTEKKKELETYFVQIKTAQDKAKKAAEEAKSAAEAAKAAAATMTGTAAPGTAPTSAATGTGTPTAAATAAPTTKTETKKEEKKGKKK